MKQHIVIFLAVLMVMTAFCEFSSAQENLADIYQRKGVKSFVDRQYDQAINDLEQARVIDPTNQKTIKLLAKCWERKGAALLEAGNNDGARNSFAMSIEINPANEESKKALARMDASRSLTPAAQISLSSQPAQQSQTVTPPQYAAPTQVPFVISPQAIGTDSQQTKVVASLLSNFQTQQQIMSQQLTASNELMKRTDEQKDEYLKALVRSSDQKNSMMSQFIIVGAVVVVVVIVVALVIFVFLFSKFAKASDLRTIQATEALQAVLANQTLAITKKEPEMLLIDGPSDGANAEVKTTGAGGGAVAVEAQTGVTCEELSAQDPSERARAVELFESEMIAVGATHPSLDLKVQKLKELLNDTNNRVRANAAKAYYLIDTTISLKIFSEMLEGGSSRLRASALWALGEIGSPETLEQIMKNENETDEIVRYNIRMALDKIKSRGKILLSKEISDRLEKLIEKYADII